MGVCYHGGMEQNRRNHPTMQVTAHDQITTRPVDSMTDDELDTYIWGDITGPDRPLYNRVPNPATGVSRNP